MDHTGTCTECIMRQYVNAKNLRHNGKSKDQRVTVSTLT